jgi:putative hydrolase of the HAD superfamily
MRRAGMQRAGMRRAARPGRRAGGGPADMMRVVSVRAVIFDWGGTLTPWHHVDQGQLWREACAPHFDPARAGAVAAAVHAAETELWDLADAGQRSATLSGVFERAGITPTDELLASYVLAWEPHTITDPQAAPLLRFLRGRGIRTGVLSNTFWPRGWHEEIFRRDGILDLIDGAVYTSEIDWNKPHPAAFEAAMAAVGVTDPAACVYVGDRPLNDIHGAQQAGMRAVLVPHSTVPSFPAAKPDAVITRLADLAPLIASWQDAEDAAPAG